MAFRSPDPVSATGGLKVDGAIQVDSFNNLSRFAPAGPLSVLVNATDIKSVPVFLEEVTGTPGYVLQVNAAGDGLEWGPGGGGGGGSQGWDDVLAIEFRSGASNPHIDEGQYLSFHNEDALPSVGDIRSSGDLEIEAVGIVTIHTPFDIELSAHSGGSADSVKLHADFVRLSTNGTDRLEIEADGSWNIGGSNGTDGQVLRSFGPSAPPQWATVSFAPLPEGINLTDTDHILEVVITGGGVADWEASFVDMFGGSGTEGSTVTNNFSGATTTVVAAPGASTQRSVVHANLYCITAGSFTIQKDDGGTDVILLGPISLTTGERIEFTGDVGWKIYFADGTEKFGPGPTGATGATGPAGSIQPATGDDDGFLSETVYDADQGNVGATGWHWDGLNGIGTCGDIADIERTDTRTISVWVATLGNRTPASAASDPQPSHQIIASKIVAATNQGWALFIEVTGAVGIYIGNSQSGQRTIIETTTFIPFTGFDREINIKVTKAANSLAVDFNFYFNDVLQPKVIFIESLTTLSSVNAANLTHGQADQTFLGISTMPFRGRMRDLAIFSSVLNGTQMAEVTAAAAGSSLNSLATCPAPSNHWKYNSVDTVSAAGIVDYGTGTTGNATASLGLDPGPTAGIVTLTTLPDGSQFDFAIWSSAGSGGSGVHQSGTGSSTAGACGGGGGCRRQKRFSRRELLDELPIRMIIAPPTPARRRGTTAGQFLRGRHGLGTAVGRLLACYGGGEGANTSTAGAGAGAGGGYMGPGMPGFTSTSQGGAPSIFNAPGLNGGGACAASNSVGGAAGNGYPALGGGGAAGGSGQTPTIVAGNGGQGDPGGGGGGSGGGLNSGTTLASVFTGGSGGISGSKSQIENDLPPGDANAQGWMPCSGGANNGGIANTTVLGGNGSDGADGDYWNSGQGGGGASGAPDIGVGGNGGHGGNPAGGGGAGGVGRGDASIARGGLAGDGGYGRIILRAYA